MNDNYHIFKNGKLKRDQNTLLLVDEDQEKHRIPIEQVEAVFCHGQLDFNTRLASFLNEKGVEIHIFGWNGQYSGSYVPKKGQVSGTTVVNQVTAYNEDEHRNKIAREIVESSMEGMRRNLIYYRRKGKNEYDSEIKKIEEVKEKVPLSEGTEELMGYEATARKQYYQLFRNEISGLEFEKRQYNPPSNEINAVLSYLNTLLYSTCTSAIRKTSLDPTVSFLHEPGERRYSLSLDIADIFKPLITTRILITCFNTSQITENNFREKSGVLLDENGRKTVTKNFEERMEETVEHPDLGRNVSYKYLLQLEAYKIKKHILTGEKYKGFEKWW